VSVWIKICGMTTPEGIAAASAAGVNAVGFVFAESVRRVTPAAAAQLAVPVRGELACIAVTRHPTQAMVDEIIEVFRPDVLQTDSEDLAALRLPRELQLLPVYRSESAQAALPSRLLFEGPSSGSGETCDWDGASRLARRTQLVLAGGLNADNVVTAVRRVRPFGVDVSSGVEARPGIKSADRIGRFVAAVRFQENP
jgi:phosphoribosylanthranilate isomerase